MPTTQQNHYEVLGVARTATLDEIKKKYRELARKLHPDILAPQNLAPATLAAKQEQFKNVTHAYDVLSDADQRRQFDFSLDFNPELGNIGLRFTSKPTTGASYEARMEEAIRNAQERIRQQILNNLRRDLQNRLANVNGFRVLNYVTLTIALITMFILRVVGKNVEQIQASFGSLIGLYGGFDFALVVWPILGVIIAAVVSAIYLVRTVWKVLPAITEFPQERIPLRNAFRGYFYSAATLGGVLGLALAAVQHF